MINTMNFKWLEHVERWGIHGNMKNQGTSLEYPHIPFRIVDG